MSSNLLNQLKIINQDRVKLADILKSKGLSFPNTGLSTLIESVNGLYKETTNVEGIWTGIPESELEEPTDYFRPAFDMDAVYESDTDKDNYTNVMMVLIDATETQQDLVASAISGFTNFKFSDAPETLYTATTHTWDASKDLSGTDDKKYRWIMCYTNTVSGAITWNKNIITPYAMVVYKGSFGAFNFRYDEVSPHYVETKEGTSFSTYQNNGGTATSTLNTHLQTFISNADTVGSLPYCCFGACDKLRYIKCTHTQTSTSRGDNLFHRLRNCWVYFKELKYSLPNSGGDNGNRGAFLEMDNCTFIIDYLPTIYGQDDWHGQYSYQNWTPTMEFHNSRYCKFKIGKVNSWRGVTALYNTRTVRCLDFDVDDVTGNIGGSVLSHGCAKCRVKINKCGGSIGGSAFNGVEFYGNLEMYDYAGADTSIGASAFANSNITGIDFSKSRVLSIGDSAFLGCEYLADVQMNAKCTTLGTYIFGRCHNLKTLVLGAAVNTIQSTTFRESDIEHLVCNDLLNAIPANAFENGAFKTIVLGENTATIGEKAFLNTTRLEKVYIPTSVTTLPVSCFHHSSIKEVEGGYGVTAVQDSAFYNCHNLETLLLPEVNTWGTNVFYDCVKLNDFIVSNKLLTYKDTTFVKGPQVIFEEGCNLDVTLNFSYCHLTADNVLKLLYSLPTLETAISLILSPSTHNTSTNTSTNFWASIKNRYIKEIDGGLEYCNAEDEGAIVLMSYVANKNYSVS